ncbi:dUTP diphosphatase [Patescibacteria group bacterium]|nr:dUTP diphosphatase [Patescibacteria group bacterium]
MKINIKKLNPDIKLPSYANIGDAGMDVYSLEDKIMEPGERYLFKLGFAMEIPNGHVGLFWDKSGIASKYGIHTLAGVIDSIYRGEFGVVMLNTSKEAYEFKKGEKLAQLLIQPVLSPELVEVDELSDTSRGDGAFGSTGK